jgi:antioxidant, ahpC/TSA family
LRSGSDHDIARHMQENNLSFPNLNDSDGLMAQKWNIAVTPTIIILKDGKMIHHTSGLSSYIGLKIRIYLADIFG